MYVCRLLSDHKVRKLFPENEQHSYWSIETAKVVILTGIEKSECQTVIDLQEFLLPQTEITPCNLRGAVVEQFGQFDECHFAVIPCLFHDPSSEGLAEGVRTEMLYLQVVPLLDFFQQDIDTLYGVDHFLFRQEASF